MKNHYCKVATIMISLLALISVLFGCGAKLKPPVSAINELNNSAYTIGVGQGASGSTVVARDLPNAKIKYYTKLMDAYLSVQQGKLDAFVYDRMTMEFNIAEGLTGVKLLPEQLGESIDIAVGISPKTDVPDLRAKLNEFIAEIRSDGTLDDMYQRWITQATNTLPDIPKSENPTLTIQVGTTGLIQPYSYYKGNELYGYDIELIQRFALWMNADVKITAYDYDGIIAAAESGFIDCVIANLNITEERKQSIDFSDPIYQSSNAVMVRDDASLASTETGMQGTKMQNAGSTSAYTSSSQLAGKTLAIITGSIFDQTVSTILPNATYSYFNSASDCVAALHAGKVDGFPVDEAMARLYTSINPDLTILPDELVKSGIGMAFPKGSELKAVFNKEIDRLKQSGFLDELADKWTGSDNSIKTLPNIANTGENGTLRVVCIPVAEPMCYVGANGAPSGYEMELLMTIAQTLGKKLELIQVDLGALSSMLESGKADMAMGCLTISDEREQVMDMTNSYYDGGIVMVVRKSTAATPGRVPVETANFGVMTGSTSEIYIGDTYPNAKISTFSALTDALTALDNKKVDYVMSNYNTALFAMRQNPSLEIFQMDVMKASCGIAVSKKNPELLTQIDDVITKFRNDGRLEKIISNWSLEKPEYTIDPRPVSDGKNGVLRVALSADFEPMCFMMDGKYNGIDCELIERIAYEMGMTVEYQNMQFSALITALVSGKADVIVSGLAITEERGETVNFSQPYFDNPQVFVARKLADTSATPLAEYTTLAQLSGKMIGCGTGTSFDQFTVNAISDAQIVYFNSAVDALEALKIGKIEGSPTDKPTAQSLIAKNPELTIVPELVAEDSYGMVLAKGSPLTAEINREIAALKADGTVDKLFDKWVNADENTKIPSLDYPAPNGTLRLACSSSTEPMCYADSNGVPQGLDVELAINIAKSLGKKVELISVDTSGVIPMVHSGKADVGLSCLSITEERKKLMDMTDAYYDGGVVIMVRKVAEPSATLNPSFIDGLKQSFIRTFVTEDRWKLVLDGLGITVLLSVCSGLLGSVIGFGICMLRRSKKKIASIPTSVFIRIIQGTPIVVLLMILYYIIFGKLDISAILVAILGFAVNFGVYVSEMIRTGIDAVDVGQIEAAQALGFTKIRTFWKITFPQAARHFLPIFRGEFISMVKMTSVVGYVAIQDLTKVSDIIRSRTLEAFFPLIATAVLYFLVANILTILLSRLEIGLDPKRRKRIVKGVVMK